MRYLCIFLSLIFLSHNSYADVVIYSVFFSDLDCIYRGTVTDLNKIDSDIELSINIKGSLFSNSHCIVSPSENIKLLVPDNKEIKIGSDVKFIATKILETKKGKLEESEDITRFVFRQWI